jgi:hypothetical protein
MGYILLAAVIQGLEGVACATTRSGLDIFAMRPVQSVVIWSCIMHSKTVTPVDQSDLEFVIPSYAEKYVDLDIHMQCGESL